MLVSLQTTPGRDLNPLFGNKVMDMLKEEATDEEEETKQKQQILTWASEIGGTERTQDNNVKTSTAATPDEEKISTTEN